jgi:type II secretory pathway pseudopilin PulG
MRRRRSGFVGVFAILATALIVGMVVVTARVTMLEFARERRAALETQGRVLVEAARAWSYVHGAELAKDQECELPIAELLPPVYAGAVQLERRSAEDGTMLIRCRVLVQRGAQAWRKELAWPAAPY